jgi:hypothetical protein
MSFFRRGRQQAKHVRGLARAAAYLTVTAAIFSALSVRAARAELKVQSIAIGRQMLELARGSSHDLTAITFNGEKMYLGSSVTDASPGAVLDRYADHCASDPGQPAAGWKDVLDAAPAAAKPASPLDGRGLVRAGDDGEGSIVCFVRSGETKATAEEAFRSFAQTGELGAFGKLRYAYAKRGPTGRTLVLTAWTDETFNVSRLVPKEGVDAPGEDFPEIPRVPNASRAITARAEGTPYALNVYKTTDSSKEVLSFYDREMVGRGFLGFDPELDEAKEGGGGRTYVKDGVVLTVATRLDPAGNFVVLGLAGVTPERP